MTKRGKVLRDTTSGPGLLMMEGQQYHFSLQGVWKSETPPKPGLVVDVELDPQHKVLSITVVSATQLPNEQSEQSMARTRLNGGDIVSALTTNAGLARLAGVALLAATWFFLPAVSIQIPFPAPLELTFWELLEVLHTGNIPELPDVRSTSGTGLYGWAAIVALAGPVLRLFWKSQRALLGGLLPLAFLSGVGIAVRNNLQAVLGAGKGTFPEISSPVSLGVGGYISILACLYFAFTSARGVVTARDNSKPQVNSPQRKAA